MTHKAPWSESNIYFFNNVWDWISLNVPNLSNARQTAVRTCTSWRDGHVKYTTIHRSNICKLFAERSKWLLQKTDHYSTDGDNCSIYLGQACAGHVFTCCICLSVCLSVHRITQKAGDEFWWNFWSDVTGNSWVDFGSDPGHDPDPGILTEFYYCGIRSTVRIVRDEVPWRRVAFSECFYVKQTNELTPSVQ